MDAKKSQIEHLKLKPGIASRHFGMPQMQLHLDRVSSCHSNHRCVAARRGYHEQKQQQLAMSTTAHKVATHAAATARGRRRRPPSVLREIVYGMSLGLLAGYLWKLHHWSNQRRTREFYSLLDQGKITVVAADEPPARS
jgi:hypothetical protein